MPSFRYCAGRQLTLEEKFAVAAKPKTGQGKNRQERAGLADEVDIAVRKEIMVTINILTDLDVANGAWGHMVEIVLNAQEEISAMQTVFYELQFPPTYILVRMI